MTPTTITPEMQVNQIIRLFPGTLPIFHAVGIDSCCGGALTVGEAARRHGLETDGLLEELRRAANDRPA